MFKFFYRNFDIYGISPGFTIHGKYKLKTQLGRILTLLTLILSVLTIFYFGQNIYYKTNPSIQTSEYYDSNPQGFKYDYKNNFIFASANDMFGMDLDQNIINVTLNEIKIKLIKNQRKIYFNEYAMEKCSEKHIENFRFKHPEFYKGLKELNLNNKFCIPINLTNLIIQGSFSFDNYQFLRFNFYPCRNSSKFNECSDNKTIYEKLKSGYASIKFRNIHLQTDKFKDYKQYSLNDEVFSSFNIDTQKELGIYFKQNEIKSDIGILFESFINEKMINYDYMHEFFLIDYDKKMSFIYFDLKMSNNKIVHTRKYLKLQTLTAQVGGVINVFLISCLIITEYIGRVLLKLYLFQNLFKVKIKKKKTKKN